ncbi:MAG: MmcQ/YjbR family DNA-binding protein [Dehalococcoidia bacterium]
MTWDDVVAVGLALPGVEVSTSYGTPALKVRKKLVARLKEDGDTLVLLQVEDIEQQFLMETRPDVFYKTPHYEGYPTVLVRLSRVDPVQLRELLETTWRRVAPKTLLTQRGTRDE